MSNDGSGGPAFPRPGNQYVPSNTGMSLRDWFAGQALSGLMVNRTDDIETDADLDAVMKGYARLAYMVADALIEERGE